ncbi:DUF5063 domain-containing protein [Massilia atriviolacea]|uniref:DUF5063 domain-containing protein n=1 Tax=Massilia atriviolacea TaxID=2495579 RepID=A0A430HF44_9BURK|nr:DUF5063 domain-containing protein [Massilia atriviolacea]RSZ56131.1 DUF5063 domain-containing protein [Massilia atriviolacea]
MNGGTSFPDAVRAFCLWAEGDLQPGAGHMSIARRHLARLYAQALDLPQRDCDWGNEAAKVSHAEWQATFERMGALPVTYYPESADALDVGCTETTMGDLADDLADIWRDLKHGLNLFDGGQADAAAYQWRESFISHWGSHAASALYVLQCWQASQPRDDAEAPASPPAIKAPAVPESRGPL